MSDQPENHDSAHPQDDVARHHPGEVADDLSVPGPPVEGDRAWTDEGSDVPTPSAGHAAPDASPEAVLSSGHADVAGRVIAALAGPRARLRPDQERAVAALATPRSRVLVVQATGWGKSAVYWAATAIRRHDGAGPTLVVSPLIALMRDQVSAAQRAGLRAATLNSGNVDDWSAIEDELRSGVLDVLLVSPERLAHPGFGRRVLDGLSGRLGLLVVDEAHAVSDWGHDFRPDYRRVSDVLRRLNPDTPVLATTATANARVTADVAGQLGPSTLVLRGPLARSSLQLVTVPEMTALQRYAWVAEQVVRLPGSGIVYTLTVADAERLTQAVRAVHGEGFPVAAYTGRLPVEDRQSLEDALRRNDLKALIATSALGMGYDKPDLGFVVHVGAPPSPVSYYQQVGRAGRAIDHALVALLPSAADAGVWEHFATSTLPDPEQARTLLGALPQRADAGPGEESTGLGLADSPDADAASVPTLEAATGLRRGRVELLLKQLAVDGAVDRVGSGWVATGAGWTYDAQHYDGIVAVRRREADIMRAYIAGERCLMRLLQEALDDVAAEDCGRCSVCLGTLPEGLPATPRTETVARVAGVLRADSHHLPPRKMWPGGAYGTRGRIPADLMADDGRALVFADAPEWGEALRGCLRHDGPVDADLLQAAVTTLSAWSRQWRRRPDLVLGLTVAGLDRVVASVGEHVAAAGRLPYARWERPTPPLPDVQPNGACEAAAWREVLDPGRDVPVPVAGRCVLLVVDATSSLWPITVAAAALREAGAEAVLPLLVHRLP